MNIGENINGYIVTKYIGGGGMGNVWKVNKDGVEYAVKIAHRQKKLFQDLIVNVD